MVTRILSSALAVAWVAAAVPALAYDPMDPTAPIYNTLASTGRAEAGRPTTQPGCRCVTDMCQHARVSGATRDAGAEAGQRGHSAERR